MKVSPPSSRQNFPESPINTIPGAAVTPSETAKQGRVEGQLNVNEREILIQAIVGAPVAPRTVLEVGTWLGGGSTLHILRALEKNGKGHLWGIEADHSIYDRMVANLKTEAPEMINRFTPLFGFSQEVIPRWIAEQPACQVDFVFLDGGNRPLEQVTEFQLLDPHIPVGGQLMAHDARLRKGKWFVPYISRLDNWRTRIHDVSSEGLLHAEKIAPEPSSASIKAAQAHLMKSRLQPSEVAAVILPRPLRAFVLRLLPQKISVQLSDGRRSA